jgi:hypothetical protein
MYAPPFCAVRIPDWVAVSVGFFDDMFIPLAYLPQPSALSATSIYRLSRALTPPARSDPQERAHFWLADATLAEGVSSLLDVPTSDRMYVDAGEAVRVRVEADEFVDEEPGPPRASEGVRLAREFKRSPYTVIVRAARGARVRRADGRAVLDRGAGARPDVVVVRERADPGRGDGGGLSGLDRLCACVLPSYAVSSLCCYLLGVLTHEPTPGLGYFLHSAGRRTTIHGLKDLDHNAYRDEAITVSRWTTALFVKDVTSREKSVIVRKCR